MNNPTDDHFHRHAANTRLDSVSCGHTEAPVPLVGGGAVVGVAEAMVAQFGEDAADAAHLRAAHARAHDNPYSYCRWKEVARVIGWMHEASGSQCRH